MFELKKWRLERRYEAVVAKGKCYGNPRFPEGLRIHTSYLVKADIRKESEEMILTTYSGSQYRLEFGEIDEEAYEATRENAEYLGLELDVERCLWLRQQAKKIQIIGGGQEL